MRVNKEKINIKSSRGHLEEKRIWGKKDTIEMELPMKVKPTKTHPMARENIGKIAFKRGPIVYCSEQVDNKDIDPSKLEVFQDVEAAYLNDLLGRIVLLGGKGLITENA